MKLDKFKQKAADNLLNAIEASKGANLDRLIFGLGIRNIGAKAALSLSERFRTMEALMAAGEEEISGIEGFGGVMAESLLDFFAKEGTKDLLERLRQAGVNMIFRGEEKTDIFLGKIFVVTALCPACRAQRRKSLLSGTGQGFLFRV